MGLFDFLRRSGHNDVRSSTRTSRPPVELVKGFITIDALGWFGPYRRSPNQRWILTWRDSDQVAHRGGHRDSGLGTYLLYDAHVGSVVVQGQMERPNNGNVADNGSFSLEDWHFGSALLGTFYVFDCEGGACLTVQLAANLVTSGISKNAKYAFCQTANSPTEDGCSLFLFDLSSGLRLFAAAPKAGWAQQYEIDEERVHLIAHIQDIGNFRYNCDGVFMDDEKLEQASLQSKHYDRALLAAERLLGQPEITQKRARQAMDAVRNARKNGADANPAWRPTALKVQGLAHEALGETKEAIQAYEEALTLNSKIGVKRKLGLLKKST